MSGYYRKFIKDYAKIIDPLRNLLKKENQNNIQSIWNEECQEAFDNIKEALKRNCLLNHPDLSNNGNPFIVTSDACKHGIGATLSQMQYGQEVVIEYASKTLKPYQTKYWPTELECLGVRWSIEHFHHYLEGRHFQIKTDHRG
eukprot:TRINITY_DN1981_c0_g2_i2.p1 TRINITY_DN1981_c0_g2~~TRINITY_DN1981_c0_g2_i2.p1  ORF type:complete len:143 (+),score=30.48 TRINITY_DN1981_c0_g2_i2:1648-2076(+)